MKRKTIETYIRSTTKPYNEIIEKAKKGGWNIEDLDNKTIKLSRDNEPTITLYFYTKKREALKYWLH